MVQIGLTPVIGNARIDVLDMLRRIAILSIFYMNIPYLGQSEALFDNDIRMIGWSVADRNCWANIASYGVGITVGSIGVAEEFAFSPIPKTIWITEEFGRLAMTLGHIAIVNLFVKTALGFALLAPYKAAGRMAFSLYFMQQFIALYILFAPFGFGLYGRFGWAELSAIAAAVVVAQLVLANLYMRVFVAGPLEWLWRSLAYVSWQPFLRPHNPSVVIGDGAYPSIA